MSSFVVRVSMRCWRSSAGVLPRTCQAAQASGSVRFVSARRGPFSRGMSLIRCRSASAAICFTVLPASSNMPPTSRLAGAPFTVPSVPSPASRFGQRASIASFAIFGSSLPNVATRGSQSRTTSSHRTPLAYSSCALPSRTSNGSSIHRSHGIVRHVSSLCALEGCKGPSPLLGVKPSTLESSHSLKRNLSTLGKLPGLSVTSQRPLRCARRSWNNLTIAILIFRWLYLARMIAAAC